MDKPKEILELERIYGIRLKERVPDNEEDIQNCYAVDAEGVVIYLNLSKNQLTEIKGLENFVNLQQLNLSDNQLTEINGLYNLVNLQQLYLSKNQLMEIKKLEKLVNLQVLNLSKNQLTEIKGLKKLVNLQRLNLSDNQLAEINGLYNLVNLQQLYLFKNQLTEIKGLDNLVNLQQLTLSDNQLTEIKELKNLVNLQRLTLSDNQLAEIKGLDNLVNLQVLTLSNNQLTEIKGLDNLVNLQVLTLSNDQLTEIKGVDNLVNLQRLNLSDNQLAEIKGLEKLVNLQVLHLFNNRLAEIKGLDNLTNLQQLKLSKNHLTEIKGLDNLTNLQQLELSKNQLTEIKGLDNLTNLQQLELSKNQLTEIKGLENLVNLQVLELYRNRLKKISGLTSIIGHLDCLRIRDNPFLKNTDLSLKGNKNHRDIILKYLSDLKQTKVEVTLPAKVMLLGNHASGKTTFRHYMQNGNLIEPKSTHILNIVPYPEKWVGLPEAIIFDFGGQDYYHGLYQAFFSEDPIYTLFWCNESNINDVRKANDETGTSTRNFTKGYWMHQLEYVYTKRNRERKAMGLEERLFSEPLLLIQTHADEKETTGRAEYQGEVQLRLKNTVGECYISLDKDTENDRLFELKREYVKALLLDEIEKKRQPREEGEYYESFLKYILEWDKEKCIEVDEVLKKYGRVEDNEENKRIILKVELEILNRKGLVLYYKENKQLSDVVWLNPAKTVKDIHDNVLSKEEVKIEYRGIVPEDAFNRLCGDEKIRELLRCEKVIFFDEKNGQGARYIVPGYLPLSHENVHYKYYHIDFIKPNFTLKFRYFIPFGLINQLICLYGDNPDDKMFWRDELMFTYNDEYKLCIKLDFSQLTIAVYINSLPGNPSKELTLKEVEKTIFRNIIDLYWEKEVNYQINRDRVNPAIPEKESFAKQVQAYLVGWDSKKDIPDDMYISVDEVLFVRTIDLENAVKNQTAIPAYGLVETGEKTANGEKIKILESTPAQNPQQINLYENFTNNKNMKKIFISFAIEDGKYKDEFIRHTAMMQKNGLIDKPFACNKIKLGVKWDETIKKEINDCDIMICLVSSYFLDSDYINRVEVKKAMEQEKTLIPIIVRPCDWENSEIEQFQVALEAKCITLKSNDLTECTENEREGQWNKIIQEMREKLFKDKK